MKAIMRGGSMDGTEREVRGLFVEGPTMLAVDGSQTREIYAWDTDDDGVIYGKFCGLYKRTDDAWELVET